MDPHVHLSPVHLLASALFSVIVFGTLHLMSLSHDNRVTRAFLALGF